MQTFRFRIKGNDPLEMKQAILFLFIQYFIVRMNHFLAKAKRPDVTRQDHLTSFFKNILEIGWVSHEPFGRKRSALIIDDHLKNPAGLIISQLGMNDRTDDRLLSPVSGLSDHFYGPPVFVAPRQKIEQVLDRSDSLSVQQLRDFRTHSLDKLNVQGELCEGLLNVLQRARFMMNRGVFTGQFGKRQSFKFIQ